MKTVVIILGTKEVICNNITEEYVDVILWFWEWGENCKMCAFDTMENKSKVIKQIIYIVPMILNPQKHRFTNICDFISWYRFIVPYNENLAI